MIHSATLKGIHECGQEGQPEEITFEVSETSLAYIPGADLQECPLTSHSLEFL